VGVLADVAGHVNALDARLVHEIVQNELAVVGCHVLTESL